MDRPKRIAQMAFLSEGGFSLDLDGAELSLVVTPNSGDVILYEGEGWGRASGMYIPGEAVDCFDVEVREQLTYIVVWYRRPDRLCMHEAGFTDDLLSAQAWVERVNHIYAQRGGDGGLAPPFEGQPRRREVEAEMLESMGVWTVDA